MFDSADRRLNERLPAVQRPLCQLEAELNNLGLLGPQWYGVNGNTVCGIAQRVSVRKTLGEQIAAKTFLAWLCQHVEEGTPVNLSLAEFCSEDSGIESWRRFCELVRKALKQRGLSARGIGLCIHSHQMPLEAYCLIADAVLGHGPRYVFLDSLQMQKHANAAVNQRAEANWLFLWRQRGMQHPVMPVYGGIVRSACPLLADEVAATVSPGTGLHGPVNSAWLPVALPMTNFATAEGQVCWQRLIRVIRESLAIAEQMLEQVVWNDPRQLADAEENRRLAFSITGLGDLVQRKGADPGSLDCLEWLAGIVKGIRCELYGQSRRLAVEYGAIPALREANHVGHWSAGPQRDAWHRRWQDALSQSAVRHRNLLVMSPYSVIPNTSPADPAFCDLLPVIGLADAWSFSGPVEFRGWDAARYRHFHCRARATIRESHTASLIAAGV